MVNFQELQNSIFRNDGVARGTHNFARRINRISRFREMAQDPPFYSTFDTCLNCCLQMLSHLDKSKIMLFGKELNVSNKKTLDLIAIIIIIPWKKIA